MVDNFLMLFAFGICELFFGFFFDDVHFLSVDLRYFPNLLILLSTLLINFNMVVLGFLLEDGLVGIVAFLLGFDDLLGFSDSFVDVFAILHLPIFDFVF